MDFFIGVDSDGTVFDTMTIKHKIAFGPLAIKVFELEQIKDAFTEAYEYVNLYSGLRGTNRFPALMLSFDRLEEQGLGEFLPDYGDLKLFCCTFTTYSNTTLTEFMKSNSSGFLDRLMEWSVSGDAIVKEHTAHNMPFENVSHALAKAKEFCNIGVISAASTKALDTEWKNGGIFQFTDLLLGQEFGSKAQQLKSVLKGGYANGKALMIGDAKGDLEAAKANDMLFYPIIPNKEGQCWRKFLEEGLDMFISGRYAGEYEERLLNKFFEALGGE